MSKNRVDDVKVRELLKLAATQLVSSGRELVAGDIHSLLAEQIEEPTVFGCNRCGGTQTEWTAHCNPDGHKPSSDTAAALKACDWANTPIGNQAIIQKAILELEAGHRQRESPATDHLSAFMAGWKGQLNLDRVPFGAGERFAHETVELAYVSWCKGSVELGAALERVNHLRGEVSHLRQHKNDYMEAAEQTRKGLELLLNAANLRNDDAVELLDRIIEAHHTGLADLTKSDIRHFLSTAAEAKEQGAEV